MNKLTAICMSTVHARNLPVLLKSIEQYVPHEVQIYIAHKDIQHMDYQSRKHAMHLVKTDAGNYGDAYNFICKRAFENHESIIVCNDDIVFHPDTYDILQKEYSFIRNEIGNLLGWLGCRTDYAAGVQNIRWSEDQKRIGVKFEYETKPVESHFIAPICAAIHRDSWIDYLPINWFSDSIQCSMMNEKGMHHIVSTAYVHHVGSQSLDSGYIEREKALDYLKENNIEYYEALK